MSAAQSDFLARLAEGLRPLRMPFYVRSPQEPGQLAGWYWQPADADEPVPLGSNVYLAQRALELARERISA